MEFELDYSPEVSLLLAEDFQRREAYKLPANCRVIFTLEEVLKYTNRGDKEYARQRLHPGYTEPYGKRKRITGPEWTGGRVDQKSVFRLMILSGEIAGRITTENGWRYMKFANWLAESIGVPFSAKFRAVLGESCHEGAAPNDLQFIALLDHTKGDEYRDLRATMLAILLAGGIRVGWHGEFPDSGDPVVYWPWDGMPEFQ